MIVPVDCERVWEVVEETVSSNCAPWKTERGGARNKCCGERSLLFSFPLSQHNTTITSSHTNTPTPYLQGLRRGCCRVRVRNDDLKTIHHQETAAKLASRLPLPLPHAPAPGGPTGALPTTTRPHARRAWCPPRRCGGHTNKQWPSTFLLPPSLYHFRRRGPSSWPSPELPHSSSVGGGMGVGRGHLGTIGYAHSGFCLAEEGAGGASPLEDATLDDFHAAVAFFSTGHSPYAVLPRWPV